MLAKLSTQSTHPALFHLRAFFLSRRGSSRGKKLSREMLRAEKYFPFWYTIRHIATAGVFLLFTLPCAKILVLIYTWSRELCGEHRKCWAFIYQFVFPFFFCVRFRLRQSTNYSTLFCSTVRSDLMSFPSQLSFAIIARNKTIEDDFPKSGTKKPQF